ncbi:ATP-grasp domain-containing protein [Enterocloster citroniae]
MKRLLIIGASILQLPAIETAKKMGLYVGVADFDPTAAGIPYADRYFNISTIDEEGIYQAAKEMEADGIMTLATDMPMRSVAYASQRLGLVGISYDTAIKATDKGEMIKAFEAAGVEHPWYFILTDIRDLEHVADNIIYPCISKPVDNAGSRGVMLIKCREELKEAVRYSFANGRRGRVIIEEYLQGSEVSVEVMALEGDIHILQVTDKLTTGAPHFVEMGHSQPSCLGKKAVDSIKDLAVRAVKSLGIYNGPAHVEIMLTEAGPRLIELGARMGGDCITTHLVPLSTGIDMVELAIRISLGEKPDIGPVYEKGSAIRYFKARPGKMKKVSGIEDAKKLYGIYQITLIKKPGDVIGEIGSSVDRIGYVISQADNAESAVRCCERAIEGITITVEEQSENG